MTTKAQHEELIKLKTEQHEELVLTIIGAADTIRAGLNEVAKAMSNGVKQPTVEVQSENIDTFGIPLDSVHHPQNPEMIASSYHTWDEKVNMWRKNQ